MSTWYKVNVKSEKKIKKYSNNRFYARGYSNNIAYKINTSDNTETFAFVRKSNCFCLFSVLLDISKKLNLSQTKTSAHIFNITLFQILFKCLDDN